MMKRGFAMMAAFFSLGISLMPLPGCGQQNAKTSPIAHQVQAEEQLPVLEQNLIYKTNHAEALPEPDYSFNEFSNGIDPVPEDAVPIPNHD